MLEQRPPVRGITLDAAAGGPAFDRYIWAGLDDVDAAGYARTKQTVDHLDASGELVTNPWDLVKVSGTDVETFVVAASTQRYDCDFVIEIHYRGRYRSEAVVVTHNGKPFRVSALPEEPYITYIEDTS